MTLDHQMFAGFQRHRNARDLSPDEDYLKPIRDNIVTYGWHVQRVPSEAGRFGWTYTIGFGDSLGHPDLVVFGFEGTGGHRLLNELGDAIARGMQFQERVRYPDILEGNFDIEFRRTLSRWAAAHFGAARDWYGNYPPMWQVLLPDAQNRFPGEPGEEVSQHQLLLSSERPAPEPLGHLHTPMKIAEGWTALAADQLHGVETGWEELLVVVRGNEPNRWVVVSVPYTEHISFGDEVEAIDDSGTLRVAGVTRTAPFATVRLCVLKADDASRERLYELVGNAEDNEVVWERPLDGWLFFGVPHRRYAWFMEAVQPLLEDGVVFPRIDRPPPP